MAELLVPERVEDPFREHYRELVLGSLARAADAQGDGRRAKPTGPGWFGAGLRSSARMVWVTTLALLVCDIAAFGLDSWTTSVAVLGLIALTFVWFWVTVDDLLPGVQPPVEQLELFELGSADM